jgi:beta-barrel assembly-enhancing protease
MIRSGREKFWCALLLLSSMGGPATANTDPKKGRVTENPSAGSYTIEQEIQLGLQGKAEIERKLKILPPDHPLSKYINNLGLQLAAKAPGYAFPYSFKVVVEKSVNAFALPGGPIYVHTGLIAAANEAELAGVMGHEISHVVMRHSARQASRQMKAQIPLAILGSVLGAGVGGLAGSLAQMGMTLTSGSVFMKYSRDAEKEADMVGAQIIYDAGYNPEAIVTFFLQLKQQGGSSKGPSFLASHPDPGDRAQSIQKILSRFPAKNYPTADSPEFTAAKQSLKNLASAPLSAAQDTTAPANLKRLDAQSIARNDWKTFQHVAFTIGYPSAWQVNGDASSSLSFWPEGGAAAGVIAYGVMVSGFQPRTKGDDLDVAFRELETDLKQSNPELETYNSPRAFMLNGRPARKLDWSGASAIREAGEALKERVQLVAIQGKSGVVIYLVFVSPEADLEVMAPIFDHILNSVSLR